MVIIIITIIIIILSFKEYREILNYLYIEEDYIIQCTLNYLHDNPSEIKYDKGIGHMIDYILNNITIKYLPNDLYKTNIHKNIFKYLVYEYLENLLCNHTIDIIGIIVNKNTDKP